MARIRSVHPGLFTDDAFIQLSDAAQIFWVGLWTEADDQGVFEWKPATLKLRLRGASVLPVEPLLAELAALDCVRQFEFGGRQFGAVRNFQRFQRPKRPNRTHVLPPEFRTYVGSDASGGELRGSEQYPSSPPGHVEAPPVPTKGELTIDDGPLVPPNEELPIRDEPSVSQNGEPPIREGPAVPRKSEMSPQMEDGGWRGEGSTPRTSPPPESVAPKRSADPRGCRLPDGWNPGDEGRSFAVGLRLDPDEVFRKFKDFWIAQPGAKGRKTDWLATWRNWCRREVGSHGTRGNGNGAGQEPAPGLPLGYVPAPLSGGF